MEKYESVQKNLKAMGGEGGGRWEGRQRKREEGRGRSGRKEQEEGAEGAGVRRRSRRDE
jgi:hypothetical protein